MSRTGFRFVHATCLCLDEHLIGTGPLSPQDRALAEDATFLAWEGIVETCIRAQVEFLVVTGNSFNARTNSLRAHVALEKGFDKLAEHNIAVFIVPGPLDPVSAWKRSVHLPPNVTLLNDEDHEPVAVMSDQRVLASIFVVASAHADESKWSESGPAAFQRHQTPLRIGLVAAGTPIRWESGKVLPLERHDGGTAAATLLTTALDQKTNYIALGDGSPRTEYYKGGIAHDPGCRRSLTSQIQGSRGCSVINVDAQGEVSIDAVAVAPIRWQEIPISVESHTNREDLLEKMTLKLMEQVPDNDERLWIVTWRVSGDGPLLDSLAKPEAQQEFWKKLEAEMAGEKGIRRVHRLEKGVRAPTERSTEKSSGSGKGLLEDFQQLLNEAPDSIFEDVRREILELDWMKHHDARFIRETLQQVSRQRIARRAQTLVSHWLE